VSWALRCPCCHAALGDLPAPYVEPLRCPVCVAVFRYADGVWDFLPARRAADFERFLAEYGTVRHAEGRGGLTAADYLDLPNVAAGHPLAWQWRIRAASADFLVHNVLGPAGAPGRSVLDLGAGNGWLSYRLARAGHRPLAVDVWADAVDGLGAAGHFDAVLSAPFPRVRAEFDALPLTDGGAEAVVFNASFHYSSDYDRTLAEACRILTATGVLVIMDSPVYATDASGQAMVAERKARFEAAYGFPSDVLGSREYLTDGELAELGARQGLAWSTHTPWYGWRWALRPWRARLRRQRVPARFVIYVGRRTGAELPVRP
jgi:SAM-dependent methyltransferase